MTKQKTRGPIKKHGISAEDTQVFGVLHFNFSSLNVCIWHKGIIYYDAFPVLF